jgi:hypothetical protein
MTAFPWSEAFPVDGAPALRCCACGPAAGGRGPPAFWGDAFPVDIASALRCCASGPAAKGRFNIEFRGDEDPAVEGAPVRRSFACGPGADPALNGARRATPSGERFTTEFGWDEVPPVEGALALPCRGREHEPGFGVRLAAGFRWDEVPAVEDASAPRFQAFGPETV